MNPAPFLAAPLVIQAHAAAALLALLLGIAQLALPKGGIRHRVLGWTWSALMLAVAASSLWISRERFAFGPFSAIHLLSILTLVAVPAGLLAARQGRIRAHRTTMVTLFVSALVVAGLFTLLPSRILGRVLFG